MKLGTKSLLFGTHQFLFHPFLVFCAWIKLYRRMPGLVELVAILVHDWGYWGCDDMDGECGLFHPVKGAWITARFARGLEKFLHSERDPEEAYFRAFKFTAGHSGSFCDLGNIPVSPLCAADKCSVLFEPWWLYWARARLTGELDEYTANGPAGISEEQWFRQLKKQFKDRYVSTRSDS